MTKKKFMPEFYESAGILSEVSRVISASLDLDRVAGLVLRESVKALGADHAALFLTDESSRFTLKAAKGFKTDEMENIRVLGGWEAVNGRLAKRRSPLLVNDVLKYPAFKAVGGALPFRSFLAVPLRKDNDVVGSIIVSSAHRTGRSFTMKDERLLVALSHHIAIALLNARLYEKLKSLFMSTVKSLVRAIDAKDSYTSGHSERVMKYSLAIARELRIGERALENLALEGILHDVGKIGVKEGVLSKPGKLDPHERREMQRHPTIGVGIVETIDESAKIIRGIHEHHERYDGNGYPKGLSRNHISIDGRIIAVADAFDALTTNRPYQKSFTPKEAFFEIRRSSSSQFDPRVVTAFMRSFSKYPRLWQVERQR